MRHLSMLRKHAPGHRLARVAELGPGDSIGIGLCALLTGSDRYLALDAKPYGSPANRHRILEEMSAWLAGDQAIPGQDEFPGVRPILEQAFRPSTITTLPTRDRIQLIAEALERLGRVTDNRQGMGISYLAPWSTEALLRHRDDPDLVYSQAVLEHVDDLETTYKALGHKLKPGALMSHTIDFTCHGIADSWFGHWKIGKRSWRIIRGRRPYLINRMPCSYHHRLLQANGFEIVHEERKMAEPLPMSDVAEDLRPLFSPDDLGTAGTYLLVRKV